MYLFESRHQGGGFFLAQHHFYPFGGFPLENRGFVGAVRVVARKDSTGELGHWIYDQLTPGDVINWFFWQSHRARRRIPAWSFAWAVKTEFTSAITPGGPTCSTAPAIDMLPIADLAFTSDKRFVHLRVQRHPNWNKFPQDHVGIGLTTTQEAFQQDLFLHADPRLISVNRGGDSDFGTRMFDTTPTFDYDVNAWARLQTAFRVVRPRPPACGGLVFHATDNTIAWQLGYPGCDTLPGLGACYELTPGNVTPLDGVVGLAGRIATGPLHVGSTSKVAVDKHRIGRTADREDVNSLHIGTQTLYFMNVIRDAAIEFQRINYSPPFRFPFLSYTHLRYDHSTSHNHVCGKKKGLWRFETEVPYYVPDDGDPTPTPSGKPVPTGGGGGDFGGGIGGKQPVPATDDSGKEDPETEKPTPVIPPLFGPCLPPFLPKRIVATTLDTAFNAILMRPQFYGQNFPDLRNNFSTDFDTIRRHDRIAPITLRIEAFGAQNESGFSYTQQNTNSCYIGGTANGGLLFLPPELDIANKDSDFNPAGITQSTSYLVNLPNVFNAWGRPDLINGALASGVSAGINATMDLIFRGHHTDTTGNKFTTESFKVFENGRIGFQVHSTTDTDPDEFYAIFTSSLTANRTYTFDDSSGTVVTAEGTNRINLTITGGQAGSPGTEVLTLRGSATSPFGIVSIPSSLQIENFIDMPELSGDPASPTADRLRLYAKDDAGTTKLYFKDSAGNVRLISFT